MTDHDFIDKKALSERDMCTKFTTPAIKEVAGWRITQFHEEFTLRKIHVRGKRVARGVRDRADYILFFNRAIPLAIIEAKDNHHDVGAGMQQAIRYAEMLDIPSKRVEQLLGWCDALEMQLKSAEEERGSLVESILARVGG